MTHARTSRPAKIVSILALVLALALTVAGCGKSASTDSKPATPAATAKAGLPVAVSALATTAPDAKLLVVQTEIPVTPTSTPVWGYLFGSQETDKTYLVRVSDGKAMPASEYGATGMNANEWAVVPNTDEWKIDSDAAYQKALPVAKAKTSAPYTMGFLTYVPSSAANSATKPFVWYVSFDPVSGASSGTVEIDAKTGAVLSK